MFSDNVQLQEHLVDLLEAGAVVLVESDRMVHQLQSRFRLRRTAVGRTGWDALRALTLKRWMNELWERLWPQFYPAPVLLEWRVLRECLAECPPPEPLAADLALAVEVGESFGHLLRYALDPGAGEEDGQNPLVEWRRRVWAVFQERLNALGFFHAEELPRRLLEAMESRPGLAPAQAVFVGFEFAGTWERRLLQNLEEHADAHWIPLPLREDFSGEALACADPDQEITQLLEDLFSQATRHPLHDLAVVVLNAATYIPLLSRRLQDLLGAPLTGEEAAYNLFAGKTLAEQPLFQAALLPLQWVRGGERREALLSLLRSPYYGELAERSRALCRWDWKWREGRVDEGIAALRGVLDHEELSLLPESGRVLWQGLAMLAKAGPCSVSGWLEALQSFWESLRFPVRAHELDEIAWENLQGMLLNLKTHDGDFRLDAGECAEWLDAAARRLPVQRRGLEEAGIQVIGGLDARGLVFGRIIVPGVVAGVLPGSPRPLPFLTAHERQGVLGGTPESQWAFAREIMGAWGTAAPEVVLTRPLMDRQGEPCLPSPFWPDGVEQRVAPVIPWRDHLPAFQRALWVQESLQGFEAAGGRSEATDTDVNFCRDEALYRVDGFIPPETISVSALETLITCPGRYFFEQVLGVEPLPEIEGGLDAGERGQRIHAIVAAWGRWWMHEAKRGGTTWEEASNALKDAALRLIGHGLHEPLWAVELKRLIGTEESPGLLLEWLKREWKRLEEGWRWTAIEASFDRLIFTPCKVALKGRLDRLDAHDNQGLICWDYKTGRLPDLREVTKDLVRPQLPVYLMAVQRGLAGQNTPKPETSLAAGYIALSAHRHLEHREVLRPGSVLVDLFSRWEAQIVETLQRLENGDFAPTMIPGGCPSFCPYHALCA